MVNTFKSITAIGLGLAVALIPFTAGAQQNAPAPGSFDKMDQAAIQRSWEIQNEVARIAGSKDAFIDQLIKDWAAVLDPNKYENLNAELGPMMQAATPWQLYAASLVGDFKGMIQVLLGKASPGTYINALSRPQPKVAPAVGVDALGSGTDSLVFTPIPPCRIVDTRGTGARTGALFPGTPRSFDLTTTAFTKGQGGSTSCTGLPSFSYYAWSANITVAGYTGDGGIQAYGFSGPVPATSVINYFAGSYAIANSGTLTGCYGCGDDITLLAFGAPTHVIVDVMGYYQNAGGFAGGVVTRLAGTTTNVLAGGFNFITGGVCPAGTVLISGSQTNSGIGTINTSDHFVTNNSTQWYEYIKNVGASTETVTVYSACMDVH